jgi:hypothetical protein
MISLPTVNGEVAGYAKFFTAVFTGKNDCPVSLPVLTWFSIDRSVVPPQILEFNALWNVTTFTNQLNCN